MVERLSYWHTICGLCWHLLKSSLIYWNWPLSRLVLSRVCNFCVLHLLLLMIYCLFLFTFLFLTILLLWSTLWPFSVKGAILNKWGWVFSFFFWCQGQLQAAMLNKRAFIRWCWHHWSTPIYIIPFAGFCRRKTFFFPSKTNKQETLNSRVMFSLKSFLFYYFFLSSRFLVVHTVCLTRHELSWPWAIFVLWPPDGTTALTASVHTSTDYRPSATWCHPLFVYEQ